MVRLKGQETNEKHSSWSGMALLCRLVCRLLGLGRGGGSWPWDSAGPINHGLTVFCLQGLLLGNRMMRLKARLVYQWQPHCCQTPGQTGQRAEEGHGKSGMAWGVGS